MNLKKKICMFATNDIAHDIRVQKEAASAVNAGYGVVVIGLSSGNERLEREQSGYKIILVPRSSSVWLKLLKITAKWILHSFVLRRANDKEGNSCISKKNFKFKVYELYLLTFIVFPHRLMKLEGIMQRADIYHANDLDTLSTAIKSAKKTGAKVLYDAHELWVEQNPEWADWFKRIAFEFEKRLIGKVNAVVTVNISIAKELHKRYHIGLPIIVHNCPHYYKSNHLNNSLLKRSIGIDPSKLVVLYQGRYEEGRGLEGLVESGSYLCDHAVIALRGYGSIEEQLRQKVHRLHLEDKVRFLSPVSTDELVASAYVADIGVVPYKAVCMNNLYATPNKIFEYLMAGLAIVASDLPEIRKILEQSNCGLLFNPDSPQEIADAINELVKNRDLLKEKKKNAFAAASNIYNWESESKKLIDAYASL